MKTKELRLGNIVGLEYPTGIEFCKVDYINSQSAGLLTSAGNLNGANIVNIKPIPLTEEWLIKFGFEEINKNDRYSLFRKNIGTYITTKGAENHLKIDLRIIGENEFLVNNVFSKTIRINSVHQLQNIYYALTSEELTIKN